MELLTTPLPSEYRLITNLGVCSSCSTIQLNRKGLIQSLTERNRDEWAEAYDKFIASAPRGATIVFGVQVSTATAQFDNGTFLYLTITGTAAIHESAQS